MTMQERLRLEHGEVEHYDEWDRDRTHDMDESGLEKYKKMTKK